LNFAPGGGIDAAPVRRSASGDALFDERFVHARAIAVDAHRASSALYPIAEREQQ
jgi:hypothetical protein